MVVDQRRHLFADESAARLLGDVMRRSQQRWPFQTNAMVLLPDHLHAMWTLPPGDSDFSCRWAWIKKEFSKRWLAAGGRDHGVSAGRLRERRRGIWQPRFWEHALEDEDEFERHFDYIHFNPVKHGHVRCPHEWPYSSFHRWVKQGVYDHHWGCMIADKPPLDFADIDETVGE